jgi:hypothetical protein
MIMNEKKEEEEQRQKTEKHINGQTGGNFPYRGGRPLADPPGPLETRRSL